MKTTIQNIKPGQCFLIVEDDNERIYTLCDDDLVVSHGMEPIPTQEFINLTLELIGAMEGY